MANKENKRGQHTERKRYKKHPISKAKIAKTKLAGILQRIHIERCKMSGERKDSNFGHTKMLEYARTVNQNNYEEARIFFQNHIKNASLELENVLALARARANVAWPDRGEGSGLARRRVVANRRDVVTSSESSASPAASDHGEGGGGLDIDEGLDEGLDAGMQETRAEGGGGRA